MEKLRRTDKTILQLDVAANLYPSVKKTVWNNTFSVSIVLTEDVRTDVLCICLSEMEKRLPGFFVSLRLGYNRCVYVPSVNNSVVSEETGAPLEYIDYHDPDKPLFRIKYKGKRITAEVFHALTDATGAMMFLRSLAARYIEHIHGIEINSPLIHSVRDKPSDDEFEDAYKKYLLSGKRTLRNVSEKGGIFYSAREEYYRLHGEPTPDYGRIERIIIKSSDLKKSAKEYDSTISEFIICASALSLYRLAPEGMELPQRIEVPAGLRRYYPTPTLRNFSTVTNMVLRKETDGETTMKTLLHSLGTQLRDASAKESLAASFVKVASLSELAVVKALPAAILQFAIQLGKKTGAACTTCFSNIGSIEFPPEMLPFVERTEFSLSRQGRGGTMFAAAGCKDLCTVSATIGSDDDSVLNAFLQILQEEKIDYIRE